MNYVFVILRVLPKNPYLGVRDPCAAAKALATRGRLSPQDDILIVIL